MGCFPSRCSGARAAATSETPTPQPRAELTLLGLQVVSKQRLDTVPMLSRIRAHAEAGVQPAIVESGPEVAELVSVSYAQLWASVEEVGRMVAGLLAGRRPGLPKHVAYLVGPGVAYAVVELAVWLSGGVCVPLSVHSPTPELEYFLEDSEASVAIADGPSERKLRPVAARLDRSFALISRAEDLSYRLSAAENATIAAGQIAVSSDSAALILYTSGTTAKPKGVVHTFKSLSSQCESLIEAWRWSRGDHTLHVLPLHHIHGVQNVLNTALFAGATVEFTPFDAAFCLKRLASGDVTCFHAIPTIYTKLLQHLERLGPEVRAESCAGLRNGSLRYMVSGSAALAVPTMRSWAEASGHVLLERYGMTEIGMALSNKLDGRRYPACVGWALPDVQVKLDSDGCILMKGGPLFQGYYRREEETARGFTEDGWFRTGDVAQVGGGSGELRALQEAARSIEVAAGRRAAEAQADAEEPLDGIYRILGRSSVDIIKSGGYKISALEIERELAQHEAIEDCAVVGKPDETWGEKVVAVCVLRRGLSLEELRKWGKARLASYKVPQELEVVRELPRNQMGKVERSRLLAGEGAGASAAAQQQPCVSQVRVYV